MEATYVLTALRCGHMMDIQGLLSLAVRPSVNREERLFSASLWTIQDDRLNLIPIPGSFPLFEESDKGYKRGAEMK